jgi:hypothetical protein
MTAFEEFRLLCQRFRVAGQINGCIWELLERLRKPKGIGKRACERVLRELRSKLTDPKSDQELMEQAAMALLDEARDWAAPRGPAIRWLPCGPIPEDKSQCADCRQPEREQRAGFRDGEKARNELLHRINAAGLAQNQVFAVKNARRLPWSWDRMRDLAQDALADPDFENRCYAKATFDFLDKAESLLATKNTSGISWSDVKGAVWMRGVTPEGLTLYGRFGSIVREILEHGPRYDDLGEPMGPPEGPQDMAPSAVDLWDEVEAVLTRLSKKTQDLVRGVIQDFESGVSLPDSIRLTADKAGLGPAEASRIFLEFQQAARLRDES